MTRGGEPVDHRRVEGLDRVARVGQREDAVEPFVAHRDKGVFVQCRTNNKDADMLQKLPVRQADGSDRPLYQEVAVLSRRWNDYGNVGIVVAPMYPEELQAVRRLCPDQTILVPDISPMSGGYAAAVRDGLFAPSHPHHLCLGCMPLVHAPPCA